MNKELIFLKKQGKIIRIDQSQSASSGCSGAVFAIYMTLAVNNTTDERKLKQRKKMDEEQVVINDLVTGC